MATGELLSEGAEERAEQVVESLPQSFSAARFADEEDTGTSPSGSPSRVGRSLLKAGRSMSSLPGPGKPRDSFNGGDKVAFVQRNLSFIKTLAQKNRACVEEEQRREVETQELKARLANKILKNAAKLKAASSNVEGDDTGGPEPPAAAAKLSAYEKGNSAVHPRSPRRGAVSPDRAERVKSSELTRKFHVDYQQYLATLAEQQAQRSREEQQEIARVQALRAALAKAVRRRLAETKNKVGELGGAVQPGSAGAPSAPLTRPSTLDSSSSRRFSSPRRMHRPPAALDIHCEDDAEEGVSVTRPSASARGTSSFHRSASVERPGASPSGESSSPADSGAASPSPLAGAASALAGGSFSKLQVGPPPSSRSSRVVERLFEVAREANQLAMARSTEEVEWMRFRKRHGIAADARVFIMSGAYLDVKASLIARGWFLNPEPESLFFHLQWALKASDIRYERLRPSQVVNHFVGSSAITTKQGLVRSLNSLVWHEEADSSAFFPRSYELLNPAAVEDFEVDFKWTGAMSILRRVVLEGGLLSVSREAFNTAKKVCEARLQFLQDLVEEDFTGDCPSIPRLTDPEWSPLLDGQCFRFPVEPAPPPTGTQPAAVSFTDRAASHHAASTSCQPQAGTLRKREVLPRPELQRCADVIEQLRVRSPQWDLDGVHNIWIVKPAGKSRGRGIGCFNSFPDIRKHCQLERISPEERFIAQKYIECPLVIRNRKFDIRQWVLVTDWNPLTVHFYDECYFRFCAEDFTLSDLSIFSHLSNNSIAKYSDRFETDDVADGQGNMWSMAQFTQFLGEKFGDAGLWESKVRPAMEKASILSFKSAQDSMQNRKGSFDVYGLDFVLDTELNAWLLEINASPSMEHSTPITARMCQEVAEDTMKVVVDVPEERERRVAAGVADPDAQGYDTGKWRLIHKAAMQVRMPTYTGIELAVVGSGAGKTAKGGKRQGQGPAAPPPNIVLAAPTS